MLRDLLLSLLLLICSCSTLQTEEYDEFEPFYVSVNGTGLWFQNEGPHNKKVTSGRNTKTTGELDLNTLTITVF